MVSGGRGSEVRYRLGSQKPRTQSDAVDLLNPRFLVPFFD